MLQRVPPEGGYTVIADDVEDGWRRAMVLMSSATPDELVDPELSPRRLLFRLFHEDGVRVFERNRWRRAAAARASASSAFCARFPPTTSRRCSSDPVTTVTCEFCNTRYEFTADDLAPLNS